MAIFTRHDTTDPKAKEVLHVMADNKFDAIGQMRSYDEMYTGMSLNLILTLVTFIALLSNTSTIGEVNKKLAIKLLIPVSLCVLGFSVTGFLFFFPVPAITCLVAFLMNALAILQLNQQVN